MIKDYILIFSEYVPSVANPLGGIFEFDQAKALKKTGLNVIFAALNISHKVNNNSKIYYKDDILVFESNVKLSSIVPGFMKHVNYKNIVNRFFRALVKEFGTPKIIHSHFFTASYYASIIKKKFGVKYITTEHSSHINKEILNRSVRFLAKRAYKSADIVIAVSKALGEKIETHFGLKPIVINNIIDVQLFKAVSPKEHEKFSFISVGNLLPIKQFEVLLKSFKEAFNDIDNVMLTIVGEGTERRNLEELICKYSLESKVKLTGYKSREEVAVLFETSDAFILLSKRETFGVAYVEAMAAGIPIIASDCGGPEDFVFDFNGVIVKNYDETVQALKNFYKKTKAFDRQEISNFAVEMFSPEQIASRILNVYEKQNIKI